MELPGPWTVAFDPEWGGPDSVQFEQLVSWPKQPEEGIKFYSGTARYRKTFDLSELPPTAGRHVYLDLGAVKDVAEVTLNGKKLATLWTAPWRVDITENLQPKNDILEIAVTNLWPNRLIGDAALPPEKRHTRTNIPFGKNQPLLESGLSWAGAIVGGGVGKKTAMNSRTRVLKTFAPRRPARYSLPFLKSVGEPSRPR